MVKDSFRRRSLGVRLSGCSNRQSVANDSPLLRHFCDAVLPMCKAAETSPATRHTFRDFNDFFGGREKIEEIASVAQSKPGTTDRKAVLNNNLHKTTFIATFGFNKCYFMILSTLTNDKHTFIDLTSPCSRS